MHTLGRSPIPAAGPGTLDIGVEAVGDVTVVTLTGPLDIYTVAGFRERVDPVAGPGRRLVVDLSGVTILDSSGLGALLRLRNRAGAGASSSVGIVCPRRRMRRIFDIVGLRPAFVMERDLAGVWRAWEADRPTAGLIQQRRPTMTRTDDPRAELLGIAARLRHLRAEHLRAGVDGAVRRKLEAEMEEVAARLDRRLGSLLPGEADREAWRAHARHGEPPPERPEATDGAPAQAEDTPPDRPSGRRPWPR